MGTRAPLPLVVLCTDFGARGAHYVAAMKGQIYSRVDDPRGVHVVDGTHEISAFQPREGSFLLDYLAPNYPPGTIFLVVVDPGVGTPRDILVARTGAGHIYVGPDNGVFTGVFARDRPETIRRVTPSAQASQAPVHTFHGRDVMAPLVARILNGTPISTLGTESPEVVQLPRDLPRVLSNGQVQCTVAFVDNFGNVVTNISKEFLHEVTPAPGRIDLLKPRECRGIPFKAAYGHVPAGTPLALVGSFDRLEFALNQDSFAGAHDLSPGTRMEFTIRRDAS